MTADQQPTSPSADVRVEAALAALHADKDWHHVSFGTWRTNYESAARISIAAADAADKTAGIVRVDTRDEATVRLIYRAVISEWDTFSPQTMTNAVLAALREQAQP